MQAALANARHLATASRLKSRTTCGPPSISGACALKKSGALSCRQSTVVDTRYNMYMRVERGHAWPCKALNEEDNDSVDEEVGNENPELKLLVDLIVEYPATRGTLAVLFG